MAYKRTARPGLTPIAFEVIALSDSTAVGPNSTTRAGAQVLDIGVETNSVRFRADGTDPTLTTGVVIPKDLAPWRFEGFNTTSVFKFQRTTATASVSVQSWKYD